MGKAKVNIIINGKYEGTYLARILDWSCYHLVIHGYCLPIQTCTRFGTFWTSTNPSNRVQFKFAHNRILVDSSSKICDATDLLDMGKIPTLTLSLTSGR